MNKINNVQFLLRQLIGHSQRIGQIRKDPMFCIASRNRLDVIKQGKDSRVVNAFVESFGGDEMLGFHSDIRQASKQLFELFAIRRENAKPVIDLKELLKELDKLPSTQSRRLLVLAIKHAYLVETSSIDSPLANEYLLPGFTNERDFWKLEAVQDKLLKLPLKINVDTLEAL